MNAHESRAETAVEAPRSNRFDGWMGWIALYAILMILSGFSA